ncbi:MAG: ABC transporter ATP-binding protein [Acidimicrobiales bacterium]
MIELSAVSVRYGAAVALRQLDEHVGAGEWVGLIGPNGAGKTTLLRAVARLVPHDGEIRIGSSLSTDLSPKQLARLVAYVPQQPELPTDMTVGSYVLLGRTPHIGYFGFETATDRAVCAELLGSLELASMAGRTLGSLSGGELQRLVLARALAQEAPVLLLDEPTSALDLGRRVDALELVDALRRDRGLTVLSAMHDLTLAGQFADRLVLLAGGRAVAAGKPDEVLTEDELTRHFGTGVRVMRSPDGELVVVPRRAR